MHRHPPAQRREEGIMGIAESAGWVAAGLTLLTFVSRDMRRLRLSALAANAGFIAYGLLAGLHPVLLLHLLLAPINAYRFFESRQTKAIEANEQTEAPAASARWTRPSRRAATMRRDAFPETPTCARPRCRGVRRVVQA